MWPSWAEAVAALVQDCHCREKEAGRALQVCANDDDSQTADVGPGTEVPSSLVADAAAYLVRRRQERQAAIMSSEDEPDEGEADEGGRADDDLEVEVLG